MNFEVIEEAGLSQREFADLAGVSRVTVNSWVRGKSIPTTKRAKRVRQLLFVLRHACDGGMLPGRLDPVKKTDTETRAKEIKRVIADTIAAVKSEKQ